MNDKTTRRQVIVAAAGAAALGFATGIPGAGRVFAQATPSASPVAIDGMKTVDTPVGVATVPMDPQRVVVMENRVDLEIATALQLPVIGVGVYMPDFGSAESFVNPWIPFTPGPEVTPFDTSEPDLEKIIQLTPDLLISRIYYVDGTFGFEYDTMAKIAPIIPVDLTTTPDGYYDWRGELRWVADILDRSALAEEPITAYETRVADVKARHATSLDTKKIVVLRTTGDGQIFVNDTSMFASVSRDLGASWIDLPVNEDGFLSMEQAGMLTDADGMLFWGSQEEWDAAMELDVWKLLPVVQAGKVVQSTVMVNFGSVYAAGEVLTHFDALYTMLD
ncbi:MAG: ABC transporter substrate-binding protein [Thermomicrobiales bacterium]